MKRTLLVIIIISSIALLGCQGAPAPVTSEENTGDKLLELAGKENGGKTGDIAVTNPPGIGSDLIDGLHVTGEPLEVDIDEYRLEVTGEIANPLSLTFDQVKDMDSKRIFAVLDCPGFFTDEGYWTGVDLKILLERAGVSDSAAEVSFISIDGYQKTLTMEQVMENEGFLVAYHFQDREFSEVHGYPLRIVASGELGYVWVKWLAEIQVLAPGSTADNAVPDKNE